MPLVGLLGLPYFLPNSMKMNCTYCGRGRVYFGEVCRECYQTNRDNTQALDQFWARSRASQARSERKSFFRPAWAIPFKLLWLPVRLAWWLVKVPF